MYDMKALYEAHSVEEAVALRLEHPEAQIIAGGSDVLVQMREGKRAGAELISIYGIDAMRGICIDEDGNIRIGSLTSFSHITRDPIIRKYINVLGEAVDMVGGPQIRNIGTIGGNTCNGVTSADSASTLHAWEAIVELTGKNGVRRLPIKDFYLRAGKVDIRAEDPDGHPHPEGKLRKLLRPLYQIRHAQRHGHRHDRLLRERRAERGQKDHRPRAHRLWRGGPRAHARPERRGAGQRPPGLPRDGRRLRAGRAAGHPSA